MICFADVDHRCEGDTTSQGFDVEAEILESNSVEEKMWLECRMVQSMTNSRLHGEIGVKCVKNLQILFACMASLPVRLLATIVSLI